MKVNEQPMRLGRNEKWGNVLRNALGPVGVVGRQTNTRGASVSRLARDRSSLAGL